MCVYLCIHNKYAQQTHIYYENNYFYYNTFIFFFFFCRFIGSTDITFTCSD